MRRMSEMAEELKPELRKFMRDLGYARSTAIKFCDGYMEHLATLPSLEKLDALANMHDGCMAAGLKKAGVREDVALKRYYKLERQ